PGAKLNVIDSVSTPDDQTTKVWYKIRLSNGNEAWISGADVEFI
ncbi:MAG: SH3 domain-containing protein, partial [Muribaculaceae bacterium]|nr:SH3 domain-containing protein [Muribaculaceae bacterium]